MNRRFKKYPTRSPCKTFLKQNLLVDLRHVGGLPTAAQHLTSPFLFCNASAVADEVALAIWFHDLIYNGVNGADEDESAVAMLHNRAVSRLRELSVLCGEDADEILADVGGE